MVRAFVFSGPTTTEPANHLRIFEYNNQKFISINGKSFFLARAYSQSDLIFIQAAGNYQLFEEDLPNSKKWRLIKTKSQDRMIYVAYNHEFHNYGSERMNGKLLFPAPTSQGSFFLVWKYVNDRFGLKIDEERLAKIPEEEYHWALDRIRDEGNSGTGVYLLRLSDGVEERFKQKFEAIISNGESGV